MAFTLTIREKGHSWAGRPPFATLHNSSAEARGELIAYVERRWDSEMDGDERPADPDEMIDQYFDFVLESYDIAQIAGK
jgi:hypothetical protein